MLNVKVKLLREGAHMPTAGSEYAAGYDLYACTGEGDVTIPAHGCAKIGTGLSVAVPEGYFGAVFARSGLASKQGLRPANCVGVCDSDYRGEYIVAMYNDSDAPHTISDGDRIAQLVILPYLRASFQAVDELPQTTRGAGGFGSTGR
jgi:dUTP pyrophosphatase